MSPAISARLGDEVDLEVSIYQFDRRVLNAPLVTGQRELARAPEEQTLARELRLSGGRVPVVRSLSATVFKSGCQREGLSANMPKSTPFP